MMATPRITEAGTPYSADNESAIGLNFFTYLDWVLALIVSSRSDASSALLKKTIRVNVFSCLEQEPGDNGFFIAINIQNQVTFL
jgi:hypothetical protein